MIGHDTSLLLSDDRPRVTEIIDDIKKVEKFVKEINKRKDQTGKQRKQKV